MRKTSIFGHQFGKFWPKWAKREFFKKEIGTFFSRLQALTNCKVSEKNNERFSRNCVTNYRMNERDSLGLQRLRWETKKSDKSSFWVILGPKWPNFYHFLVKIRPIRVWQKTKNFNSIYTNHISTKCKNLKKTTYFVR